MRDIAEMDLEIIYRLYHKWILSNIDERASDQRKSEFGDTKIIVMVSYKQHS